MEKNKLAIFVVSLAIYPIILCGCWNYREIDDLAIVAGVAIDKDLATSQYRITTEIITTESQGGISKISSELYSSEGESIFNAVRNTIEKTGLKLFWSDAKVIIISESLAKEGVSPEIDWLNRNSGTRPDMWLIIAKGTSASEILKAKVKLNEIVSFHLDDTMKSGQNLSKFTSSKLWSVIDEISSEESATTIATVKNEPSDNTIASRLNGTAIIKLDKLVGYLDGNETLYMLMIKNKTKSGLITLKNVSDSNTDITLEIFDNRTKLTPLYSNGVLSMIIDIYPILGISEVQGTKDFMKEENLKILQSEAEKKIRAQVQYLITKLQKDYDSDVLGFEEIFNKQKPKVSKIFKKNGEDMFVNMKTEINVYVQISGSAKNSKPISIGK